MPQEKIWCNPNKQDLTTGHKTFDRQLTAISEGQVLGGTQTAFSIRPFNETIGPVGQVCDPGYFQDFDLDHFPKMPERVRRCVKAMAIDCNIMVHEFFTWRGERKNIIGYLLVQYGQGKRKVLVGAFVVIHRATSYRVLDACAPYVADMEEGEAVPYDWYR